MTRVIHARHGMQFALAMLVGIAMGLAAFVFGREGVSSRLLPVVIGLLASVVVVLAFGNLRRLLVAAIFLDMATGVDVNITCDLSVLNSACGFNISVTLLALAGLYALWIIDIRRSKNHLYVQKPRLGLIGWLGVCFVLACMVSITAAPNPIFALYRLELLVLSLALLFYLANNLHSQQEILYVLVLMAMGLVIQNSIMQLQNLGALEKDTLTRLLHRVSGTFLSPNNAGAYLMQSSLMLLACLALRAPTGQKVLLGVLAFVSLANMIGTESRGSWTGFIVGLVIIVVGSLLKRWFSFRALMFALLAVIILMASSSGAIINRLTADDHGAAEARKPLAEIAFNMIRANPVTGVGLNNFGFVLRDYIEPDQYGAWLSLVHNAWLLTWSETGTLGMFFNVAFWLAILWYALRLYLRGHPTYSVIGLAIIASMAGATSHMMVEIFAHRVLTQIIWTNAALVIAMTRLQYQDAAVSQRVLQQVDQIASSYLESGRKAT